MTQAAKGRTVIDLGSTKVVIGMDDARAVRTALLELIDHLNSRYRAYLTDTANGAITLQEGQVDIGGWVLQSSSGKLVVMHRGPEVTMLHIADVANTGGRWSVQWASREVVPRPTPALVEVGKAPGTP